MLILLLEVVRTHTGVAHPLKRASTNPLWHTKPAQTYEFQVKPQYLVFGVWCLVPSVWHTALTAKMILLERNPTLGPNSYWPTISHSPTHLNRLLKDFSPVYILHTN